MKKFKILIIVILLHTLCTGMVLFAQQDVSAVWARLYGRSTTQKQKYQVLQNIVEQHSRDMIPVLQTALDEQIRALKTPRNTTEMELAFSITKMVVTELGRLKATESAPFVWEVVESVDDPFLKGEAIIAVGKMGASEYAEELSLMLRNINFNFDSIGNQRENEIIAYALVIALERLKQPVGYTPVFFASTGWYSGVSGVKELAQEAMLTMIDDPTDQLSQIVTDEADYNIKLHALESALNSNAPDEKKAQIASLGFKEGIRNSDRNKKERYALQSLRIESANAISQFSEKDETVLPVMREMILGYMKDRVYDEDEMLAVLNALGSFSSNEAASILSEFVAYLSERREGRPTDSLRIAKAAIIALGNTGNQIGMEELNMVIISPYWENSVRRLAEEALKNLQ